VAAAEAAAVATAEPAGKQMSQRFAQTRVNTWDVRRNCP